MKSRPEAKAAFSVNVVVRLNNMASLCRVIGVRRQFLPDIVTVEEAQRLFATTRTLSYRVFFFTLYSLGLRLSEGLALKVGDIDGARGRVHVRDAKGNRDRLVLAQKPGREQQNGSFPVSKSIP